MDKDMKTKINDILSENGKRELSMDELDIVTGGYSESDLTSEELRYINQIMKAYVDAFLNGNSEEEQKYQQLRPQNAGKIRLKPS